MADKYVGLYELKQFILDFLAEKDGFIDYVYVLAAGAEHGEGAVPIGIAMGQLLAAGLVEEQDEGLRTKVRLKEDTEKNMERD